MKVAILYDRVPEKGATLDHLDVLAQARAVGEALLALGHLPKEFFISLDIKASLESLKLWRPDLVFNLVESMEESGRLIHIIPSILDSMGIPYTGASSDAIYLTSNKLISKKILVAGGISTPEYVTLENTGNGALSRSGYYIIKSVWEHASTGLEDSSVIAGQSHEKIASEIRGRIKRIGGDFFAERYIEGREFNLSILGSRGRPVILPPAEILFKNYSDDKLKIVGYKAKWDESSFEYHNTVRNFNFKEDDDFLLEQLKDIAGKCWNLFGLRGYARVDFRVDRDSRPWVLEVNTNPCLSPDAGFAVAASKAGMDLKDVVERIITESA